MTDRLKILPSCNFVGRWYKQLRPRYTKYLNNQFVPRYTKYLNNQFLLSFQNEVRQISDFQNLKTKQDSIPAACITPTWKLYVLKFQLPPPDVASGGEGVGFQINKFELVSSNHHPGWLALPPQENPGSATATSPPVETKHRGQQ